MADLNRYMTKTLHLLIMDDATFSHTFSHLHDISIAITISQHLYSDFSPFHLPVKEKEKQWRMNGLNMVQWINFNQNNKSVLVCQYSALWKNWPYPPIASVFYSRQAGWQTDKIQVDFYFFKILHRLNYSDKVCALFNINVVLLLHLNQPFSSKAYFKARGFLSGQKNSFIF